MNTQKILNKKNIINAFKQLDTCLNKHGYYYQVNATGDNTGFIIKEKPILELGE